MREQRTGVRAQAGRKTFVRTERTSVEMILLSRYHPAECDERTTKIVGLAMT